MYNTFQINDNGNINYEELSITNVNSYSSKRNLIGALVDDLDVGENSHLYYRETMDTDILYVSTPKYACPVYLKIRT